MSVYSFLIRFRKFYFLTQIDDFAKGIALGYTPFLSIFKIVSFFEYLAFLERIFAKNNYFLCVDSFLIRFRQFYFLAFAYAPFFSILKMVPFFER